MSVLQDLEPQGVFHFFEEISRIPRGTFNTRAISNYCVEFAQSRKLQVIQDEAGNIIIRKPGTSGYEDSAPVILQGHMDMVCEKTPNSTHDFEKDGIELVVDGEYVKAKDTTLGADNGIAMAMVLNLLDRDDLVHPPLEAVFTVDEETGMGGAQALDLGQLKGRNLINLDSEEEGVITAGCAGGFRLQYHFPLPKESFTGVGLTIKIHGLQGGHSGQEIHKQNGNAHKLMGRLLNHLKAEYELHLIRIDGGSKDNVIAMIDEAEIAVKTADRAAVVREIAAAKRVWDDEFMGDEPGLQVDISERELHSEPVGELAATAGIIDFLATAPNGVIEYSRKLKGLVETSLNLGFIYTKEDGVTGAFMIRSSVESKKTQMWELLRSLVIRCGGTPEKIGEYPAWQFKPQSLLRDTMVHAYRQLFGKEPVVSTVHAGLECGLFIGKKPELDCVSVGPEMNDVHSVKEQLNIQSTRRTWKYLLEILRELK